MKDIMEDIFNPTKKEIIIGDPNSLLFACGKNEHSELSFKGYKYIERPSGLKLSSKIKIIEVSSGRNHTAFITEKGYLYLFGSTLHEKLGLGHLGVVNVHNPTLFPESKNEEICQVACGDYHTLALFDNGEVWGWGGTLHKKLGNRNPKPTPLKGFSKVNVVKIGCGDFHSVALSDNGILFTWGGGGSHFNKGQLGHGTLDNILTPRPMNFFKDMPVHDFACGGYHTSVICTNHEVFSWGSGIYGQLGTGEKGDSLTPAQVLIPENVFIHQISCGGNHTFFLTDNGKLYSCGKVIHGQTGHNKKKNIFIPKLVKNISNKFVRKVACGWNHTVALVNPHHVYATGHGELGQLGITGLKNKRQFELVEALKGKNVADIFAGGSHSWFLMDDEGPNVENYEEPSELYHSVSNKSEKKDEEARANFNNIPSSGYGKVSKKNFIPKKKNKKKKKKNIFLNSDDDEEDPFHYQAKSDDEGRPKKKDKYNFGKTQGYRLKTAQAHYPDQQDEYSEDPGDDEQEDLPLNYKKKFQNDVELYQEGEPEEENLSLNSLNAYDPDLNKTPEEGNKKKIDRKETNLVEFNKNEGEEYEEYEEYELEDEDDIDHKNENQIENNNTYLQNMRSLESKDDEDELNNNDEEEYEDDEEDDEEEDLIAKKIQERIQNSQIDSNDFQSNASNLFKQQKLNTPENIKRPLISNHSSKKSNNFLKNPADIKRKPSEYFNESERVVITISDNENPNENNLYDDEQDLQGDEEEIITEFEEIINNNNREEVLAKVYIHVIFTKFKYNHKYIIINYKKKYEVMVKNGIIGAIEHVRKQDPNLVESHFKKWDEYYIEKRGMFEIFGNENKEGVESYVCMLVQDSVIYENYFKDKSFYESNYDFLNNKKYSMGVMYKFTPDQIESDPKWKILNRAYEIFALFLYQYIDSIKIYELRSDSFI